MGFCSPDEYDEFPRDCPRFERSLLRAGITLVKYWLSVSDEEQERRFQKRIKQPHKRWKLSTNDVQARAHGVDCSEAMDVMFPHTDTDDSRWWVVEANDKRTARLNQERTYERPPRETQRTVPSRYVVD